MGIALLILGLWITGIYLTNNIYPRIDGEGIIRLYQLLMKQPTT